MLQILIENEYGCVPKPSEISFKAQDDVIENFCAGKASIKKVTASCTINGSEFSFPFYAARIGKD
ncbi:MAG: hypothetical protein IJP10_03915 [Clostridia bacterium]|nr:hypothetical protein [Clostridia bacterium]